MYQNKEAFTLIELLVVVLIIGILAAVALPQYKMTVIKARVSTVLPILKSMVEAEEIYYLSNGEYTSDGRELEVEIPTECNIATGGNEGEFWRCGKYFLLDYGGGDEALATYCPDKNDSYETCRAVRDFQIVFRYAHATNRPGDRFCVIYNNSSLGKRICAALSLS
ncbi:MAG: prepilin-type N-terminal cleavage/methylation domain-containing protein [Elusimicrobiaceae bacterium]|nr:prepilin-type N-terminal cleavage/methylation domain-containing protein [Elusimicrobiaceae bacterium]